MKKEDRQDILTDLINMRAEKNLWTTIAVLGFLFTVTTNATEKTRDTILLVVTLASTIMYCLSSYGKRKLMEILAEE